MGYFSSSYFSLLLCVGRRLLVLGGFTMCSGSAGWLVVRVVNDDNAAGSALLAMANNAGNGLRADGILGILDAGEVVGLVIRRVGGDAPDGQAHA